jgi:cellulose synthase/poly-beta-1,6-N-acetylglucosamine synthase-like glycosyltransferase
MWLVIPAKNEEARIEVTVREYLAGMSHRDNLVVVVNGSTDDTAQVVQAIARQDRRVKLVIEPKPIGKGGAILRGFELVQEDAHARDVVCYADADGSVRVEDLLRLAAEVDTGELALGSRWLDPRMMVKRQPLSRRIASRTFNRLVRDLLDLDITDTQCAAKAMRVADLPRLMPRITETGFGFDVDLLMAAREAGMDIFESAIPWKDVPGSSVTLRRAAPEMFRELLAIRHKYGQHGTPRPAHPGAPLIDRPIAFPVLVTVQKFVLLAVVAFLIAGALRVPLATALILNAGCIVFYLLANSFKLLLVHRAFESPREVTISAEQIASLDRDQLPIYTILVPVYHEASVLPQVVSGIGKLDYPADKLNVKILLEADDLETIAAAQLLDLPDTFEICRVPDIGPRGKPRACNYGLTRATGKYLVIFDAEDQPEPDQLLKAVWTFQNSDPSVVCLQAKLNYFNRDQNLLTRWFTAEYSTWFDLLLPGLYSMNVAIPLGGTSNHFDTARLRELGAWDAYNVTEDADLGIRLYTAGYSTAVIDSTTYEEANSRPYNWIRQRSRWVKGYLQTYLVHMRKPIRLYRQLGPRAFFVFQLFVGGNVLTLLLNPIYWLLTILWFGIHLHLIQVLFPAPLMYAGMLGLLLGNFVFTFAAMAGCIRRRNYADVKYAALTPIYWIMMSVAAWKGFLQLFYKPFYWEKTIHGHYLFREDVSQAMVESEIQVASRPAPQPEMGSGLSLPTLAGSVPQPKWTPPDG